MLKHEYIDANFKHSFTFRDVEWISQVLEHPVLVHNPAKNVILIAIASQESNLGALKVRVEPNIHESCSDNCHGSWNFCEIEYLC